MQQFPVLFLDLEKATPPPLFSRERGCFKIISAAKFLVLKIFI
ncbi:MAG: hypothetical protein ACI9S8_002889 [Chlamydiales bacterium]|jgi:hypothetical protein